MLITILFSPPVYLHTPEASELSCCGVVGAAHALPQLVRVAYIVVNVICDIYKTWIANRQTGRTEMKRSLAQMASSFKMKLNPTVWIQQYFVKSTLLRCQSCQ